MEASDSKEQQPALVCARLSHVPQLTRFQLWMVEVETSRAAPREWMEASAHTHLGELKPS